MDPNATGRAVEKEPIVQYPSKFKDIDLSPQRRENELYCDYKCRQWWAKRLIKFYLKGVPIWQGHQGQRIGSFSVR